MSWRKLICLGCILAVGIPAVFSQVFVTEDGEPMTTEDGLSFLVDESYLPTQPQFGADAGLAWDSGPGWGPGDWGMDLRQKKMKEDRLRVIRHIMAGDGAQYAKFVDDASSNNMTVILCFPAGGSNGYATPTAQAYADNVINLLSGVSGHIDGTTSQTVIAAELGNEEDAGQKWSIAPAGNYAGGVNFATYYVQAASAVGKNWAELEIISGGSLAGHGAFRQYEQPGVGEKSRAFLCGFIAILLT